MHVYGSGPRLDFVHTAEASSSKMSFLGTRSMRILTWPLLIDFLFKLRLMIDTLNHHHFYLNSLPFSSHLQQYLPSLHDFLLFIEIFNYILPWIRCFEVKYFTWDTSILKCLERENTIKPFNIETFYHSFLMNIPGCTSLPYSWHHNHLSDLGTHFSLGSSSRTMEWSNSYWSI